MTAPILVTGATGNIGKVVVAGLLAAGVPVRAAGFHAQGVIDEFGDTVEAVALDFTNPDTWAAAYEGVDQVFLMRPPQLSKIARDMVPSLEAAKAAGVESMVLLSLQGAEHNKTVPHHDLEVWLKESGLDWTFVRPSFFMENLTTTHLTDIRDRDNLMVPAGNGATSFVAADDIARVAVEALLHPADHVNKGWTPTGPEALTYTQVAATISDVLGREITYAKPGIFRYARHARSVLGMPWGMVFVTIMIYSIARAGKASGLTDDVKTVTGNEPIGFAQWAKDHAEQWAPEPKH
ncbi:NmrA family NAD(P)-binding protein [Demequina aurantiaca]|uniref:NmrA family NAD(P)-binding protein n=1 Tax=Demequina aurantiaca TaxID=676200 RepID=UPI0007861E98|nr:NmrA family NAD(P)-binding protein [Demequina aurantiaca]